MLEWIDTGVRSKKFWKAFGKSLAQMHYKIHPCFGLDHDNYMGAVPQSNTCTNDWVQFFMHQRLNPLMARCSNKKLLTKNHTRQFTKLFTRIPELFNPEPPALLHGDLWSGNFICNKMEEPVLIDPAVYYGHRSMDLGMTSLFGGFDRSFYEAYNHHYPLPHNHSEQWMVSNLYPLLIHLYLFGKSYLAQIEDTLRRYQ